ncbi:Ppx/GppA family phosphatase [Ferrimonas sediminicola]|uniref:Ppx/GppA family phosphatase n=1 Tax=Ferrimonas sediminicola TaxID=2569538 RepID=A0A4U1BIH4_9GAMM|nr:Ppx/GppA phosphatase family protein [Ferrimonas sediminicola]TKB51133.1 Ppx/GppA family phosphatase [Ferrimonas sediminicola]
MTSVNTHNGGLLAAVTLGSNSFNLLLAEPVPAALPHIVAKHKRKVRLAEGMDRQGLSPEAEARGLACLAWFGEILAQSRPARVAVLATAALRGAANGAEFCRRAEPLLGYPIEVISGEREAELIYTGMRASTQVTGEALVIDIGGASTELVVGDEEHVHYKHSFDLGCVLYTQGYFSGEINEAAFEAADAAVRARLAGELPRLSALSWQHCLGVSGTVRALFELAEAQGAPRKALTPGYLRRVRQSLCQDGAALLQQLDEERRIPFAAGVAILLTLFELLAIPALGLAGGALREGVLHQLQNAEEAGT